QEGHYEMLDALQPKNVVPAHQDMSGYSDYVTLCENEGYQVGRDLHVSRNGDIVRITE
ncbi:ribonuclease J, partial [Halobacteriales archaeon QS_7_69_60]